MQGWPYIPSVQDILFMYAKEAFEPDIITATGLDQEFPEEGVQWGEKQGLSREWMLKYWYAHWDYPSLTQGYEMLHRGVIGKEELDMLYRIVEMPKFWHDKMTEIAYNPFTRVDVRRMHKEKTLTDDDLLKAYKDIGYDDWHAEKLRDFTIAYNAKDTKSLTLSHVTKAYADKYVTREDALDFVVGLGYSEDEADFLLYLKDYEEVNDVQNDIIASIRDRYTGNLIDRNEALDRLGKLNLPAMKVDSLLERWDVKRSLDVKVPSKTDLDKFLRNKIIDEDKYRTEMQRLGYGWVYTDWYLSLIKKGKAG